jgi:hypothetical protein
MPLRFGASLRSTSCFKGTIHLNINLDWQMRNLPSSRELGMDDSLVPIHLVLAPCYERAPIMNVTRNDIENPPRAVYRSTSSLLHYESQGHALVQEPQAPFGSLRIDWIHEYTTLT